MLPIEKRTKTVESLINGVSEVVDGFDYDIKSIGKSMNTLFAVISSALSEDALELLYNQVYLEKIGRKYEEIITKKYEEILGVPNEQFMELEDEYETVNECWEWIDQISHITCFFIDDDEKLNLTNIKAKIAEVEKVFREFQKQVIFKDVKSEENIVS